MPRPTPASPQARTPSRGAVVATLAALVLLGFGLRLWEFRHGLPFVLHSDSIQVMQAAQFLRDGSFVERSSYPATHTWAYVAADVAAFAVDRLLPVAHWLAGPDGSDGARGSAGAHWQDWDDFVLALQDPGVHHAIGRVYTAFAGAWLAVGVYLLARAGFPRGTALLAAAIVTCCPALVLSSHQVRIHVPGITLLAFAAVPLLRVVLRRAAPAGGAAVASAVSAAPAVPGAPTAAADAGARRSLDMRACLFAGAAVGAVASVFQLGFVLLASGCLALLCLRRPWRFAVLQAALVSGGFAIAFLALALAAHWPGLVRDPAGESLLHDAATLGIPGPTLGFRFAECFPAFVRNFTLAEPLRVAAVLLLLLACRRGRASWRTAGAYLAYPVVLLLVLGTNYTDVRYSMSAVVCLAPLAAAGAFAPASRSARIVLAALLVLAPLATSVRALALLGTADTRFVLDELLTRLDAQRPDPAPSDLAPSRPESPSIGAPALAPPSIALQDALVLDRGALPPGALQFPRYDDVQDWGRETGSPREELRRTGALAYARIPGTRWAAGPLDASSLERLGFRLHGTLSSAPRSRPCLPDVPDTLCLDVWRTTRTGPPIDLWIRAGAPGDELRARLARLVPAHEFATWPGREREGAAAAAAAAARADAATAAQAAARSSARAAPAPARDANRIDAAQLARLLALPTDRWHDAGGALGPVQGLAPTLLARGTLRGTEPLLLLVEGARPGARCHLVLGTRELRQRFRGGLLVPAPELIVGGLVVGPDGRVPLAALWPRGTPGGVPVCAQAWIEDAAGPAGFLATNAVSATSPD